LTRRDGRRAPAPALVSYAAYGALADVKEALQAATLWNYIYHPAEYGPVLPVSRSWDFVGGAVNSDWKCARCQISSRRIACPPIPSHLIPSHRIVSPPSHRIASHRIASHRIASNRIASHRIASHRISSHLVSSRLISSQVRHLRLGQHLRVVHDLPRPGE
jgi:hypothetical protein